MAATSVALDHRDRARLVRRGDVEHLLALAGVGEAFVLGTTKPRPCRARDQELAAALMTEGATTSASCSSR